MQSDDLTWNSEAPLDQQTVLATFVLEGLPQLEAIVNEAQQALGEATGDPSFDAYVSARPDRVKAQCRAIYETIRARHLTYRVEPPDSLPRMKQTIRMADEVLGKGHGTCIDLVLLMASAVRHVGINPIVVAVSGPAKGPDGALRQAMQPTHAILGYWTAQICISDEGGVSRPVLPWLDLRRQLLNLAFVECTGLAEGSSKDYDSAEQEALSRLPRVSRGKRSVGTKHCKVWFGVDVYACRRLRIHAVNVAGLPPAQIAEWLSLIENGRIALRYTTVERLVRATRDYAFGRLAVQFFASAVSGKERRRDPTERYWSYYALGEIGGLEAERALAAGLQDDDDYARQGAEEALAKRLGART